MKFANTKLTVPYYSQFIDVSDSFWMLRGCGAVSFAMVTEFHGIKIPSIVEFCNEAKDRGGYDMVNGWVHDYLVSKAKECGLQAERKEGLTDINEILASLEKGNPVIVSVEKRVLEQKRFHILVVVGYEDLPAMPAHAEHAGGVIIYHEPESTDRDRGQYRRCDTATFMNYWRGKAIFISKS